MTDNYRNHIESHVLCAALLIGIVLSMSCIQSASALTYYVRPDGNDSNLGTGPVAVLAWQTIDKAADTIIAGDIVYVAPGTYSEQVTPSNDGNVGSPIRFIADPTCANFPDILIPGPIVITDPGSDVIKVDDDDYIEFVGFTVMGGKKGIKWKDSLGGRIDSCMVYNNDDEGIEIDKSELTIVNSSIYSNSKDGIEIREDCTVVIADCEIYNNDPQNDDGDRGHGIRVEKDDNVITVARTYIHSNNESNFYVKSGSEDSIVLLVNCLITRSGNMKSGNEDVDGVQNNGDGCVIEMWHCTVAENYDDGIEVEDGSITATNCIVAFNGIGAGDGFGLRRGGGILTHTYNVVHNNSSGNFYGTSQSTGEVTTDPLFANIGSADYRLSSGSPGVDSGIDGSAYTNIDMDGNVRPVAAGWDMGCYEGSAFSLFTDVTLSLGFGVQTTTSESNGSGFYWADFDSDGDLDAIITGDSAHVMDNVNEGTSFVAVPMGDVRRQGAIADMDNDGDIDFWAANVGSSDIERYFDNTGTGVFINSGDMGFSQPTNNEACAVGDLDADGWTDIVMFSENGNWIGLHQQIVPVQFVGTDQWVYGLNNPGDSDYFGNGDYCSSADVNDDGRMDFFYHYANGKLFLSEGDGTYLKNVTSGIVVDTGNTIKIGSAWADYDNDGYLDLYVPHYDPHIVTPGYLWHNNKDGTFTNVNLNGAAGITNVNGQRSCCWGDYDNDGFVDLYICTRSGGNELYRNLGTGMFLKVMEGAEVTGNNHDAAFVDFDNDGDLDISISRQDPDAAVLLKNNLVETFGNTNYLKVWAIGAGSGGTNKAAVGVRVELYDSTGTTFIARRDVGGSRGYAGGNSLWVQFGGIDPVQTYLVKVYFNSGIKQQTVVPGTISTTIGATNIPQMIMLEEPPVAKRVIQWQEDDPLDP